jgi:hypothetical protein
MQSFLESVKSLNPLKKYTQKVYPVSHHAPHASGTEMTVFRKSGGKKRSRRVKKSKSRRSKSKRSMRRKSKSKKSMRRKSRKSKSRSRRH